MSDLRWPILAFETLLCQVSNIFQANDNTCTYINIIVYAENIGWGTAL